VAVNGARGVFFKAKKTKSTKFATEILFVDVGQFLDCKSRMYQAHVPAKSFRNLYMQDLVSKNDTKARE
jgi:hypothetical protein